MESRSRQPAESGGASVAGRGPWVGFDEHGHRRPLRKRPRVAGQG